MSKFLCILIGLGMTAALAAATQAHEGATGAAKERMDLMESMSKDMKDILKYIKANRDLGAIAPLATHIHDTAPGIAPLFPPGSNTGITDAKAEIWQKWNDFERMVQKLEETTAQLAAIAGSSDAAAINTQFRAVVHSCTDCHSDFRRGRADKL
jgi:cytochrome c556